MRAAKAQASLCICTDSPESSSLDNAIGTNFIACAGPSMFTLGILMKAVQGTRHVLYLRPGQAQKEYSGSETRICRKNV